MAKLGFGVRVGPFERRPVFHRHPRWDGGCVAANAMAKNRVTPEGLDELALSLAVGSEFPSCPCACVGFTDRLRSRAVFDSDFVCRRFDADSVRS